MALCSFANACIVSSKYFENAEDLFTKRKNIAVSTFVESVGHKETGLLPTGKGIPAVVNPLCSHIIIIPFG